MARVNVFEEDYYPPVSDVTFADNSFLHNVVDNIVYCPAQLLRTIQNDE
jgi:hypothetical protein